MKKKVVAALMCLTMAMSLAACGGGSGSSEGESASKGDSKNEERVVELWTFRSMSVSFTTWESLRT